jgi:hypothetical protein
MSRRQNHAKNSDQRQYGKNEVIKGWQQGREIRRGMTTGTIRTVPRTALPS